MPFFLENCRPGTILYPIKIVKLEFYRYQLILPAMLMLCPILTSEWAENYEIGNTDKLKKLLKKPIEYSARKLIAILRKMLALGILNRQKEESLIDTIQELEEVILKANAL